VARVLASNAMISCSAPLCWTWPTVLGLLDCRWAGHARPGVPILESPVVPEFIETYEIAGAREESAYPDPAEEDPWAAQEA